MSGFFVYILRCADGSLYTGWTTEPQRRLIEHNQGIASRYTRARLPVIMVYQQELESRSAALKRECAIKKLPKAEKEALIFPAA